MNKEITDKILKFEMPRYEEIPAIDLYVDQVIAYIEAVLAPITPNKNEKILTSSMINNYVKQGLIPPTVKKKYSRTHIAYLFFICISKQLFSIEEIKNMIDIQKKYMDAVRPYNYLCTELENILKATFTNEDLPLDSTTNDTDLRYFIRCGLIGYAQKLYTQNLIIDFQNRKGTE